MPKIDKPSERELMEKKEGEKGEGEKGRRKNALAAERKYTRGRLKTRVCVVGRWWVDRFSRPIEAKSKLRRVKIGRGEIVIDKRARVDRERISDRKKFERDGFGVSRIPSESILSYVPIPFKIYLV